MSKLVLHPRRSAFNQRLSASSGFSLVELLIYMGILGAVSGILVGVLTTVTKTQIEESTLNDVSGQLAFVTQTVQRLVRDSSLIELDAGVATSTLKLRMPELANDPTYIYLSSGQIYVKVTDAGSAQTITSDKVTVDSLQFKKLSQPPGKDTVQIDISMSAVQQAAGKTISRASRTAVSRVSAATFDSPLLPNADNSYAVGTDAPALRWKTASFSQGVNMATVSGNVGIGTTNPTVLLHIYGATPAINITPSATGQISAVRFTDNTSSGKGGVSYDATNDLIRLTRTISTSATNGIVIDNTGNVGIGTTNPLQKLQIGDNSVAALGLRIAAAGVNWDEITNASSSLTIGSGAGVYLTFNKDSPYYSSFDLGNVGIGTTTPTTAGLVIATQVGTTTLDVTGGKIINLGTPVNSTDATTKAYVDAAGGKFVVGLNPFTNVWGMTAACVWSSSGGYKYISNALPTGSFVGNIAGSGGGYGMNCIANLLSKTVAGSVVVCDGQPFYSSYGSTISTVNYFTCGNPVSITPP